MFVDHIRIYAKAGDGGNGSASFRREKYVPKGGPDGGDGGKGGDVILRVDPHTDNLRTFFYQPNYKAESGQHGRGQKKTGRSGKTLILKVPPGTLVYRITEPSSPPSRDNNGEQSHPDETGNGEDDEGTEFVYVTEDGEEEDEFDDTAVERDEEDNGEDEEAEPGLEDAPALDEETPFTEGPDRELLADLTDLGQEFVLCAGGAGGKGNVHFKSATNQAPLEWEPGEPGGEGQFFLELRRIADAGLVGFPNAGKSTLLTKLSAAHPKVAAYPFTTLKPMVGVVEFSGFSRATVADIPGLIEGAHDNVGLGHEFLRHIMRCQILLFVVDIAGSEGRDPVSDIQTLRKEIRLYSEELGQRPWLILANKMDLDGAPENLDILRARFPKVEILPIAAEYEEGLDVLKAHLNELVGHRPA